MKLTTLLLFISTLVHASAGNLDEVDYPNKPALQTLASDTYDVSIQVPVEWQRMEPLRNEIFFYAGSLRGSQGATLVRASRVSGLHLTEPKDYVSKLTQEAWLQMVRPSAPDIQIQLFDTVQLGGLPARRIIYTATDAGHKMTNLMYQTLKGDLIITVISLCPAEDFSLLYNDFELISSSFRFVGDGREIEQGAGVNP